MNTPYYTTQLHKTPTHWKWTITINWPLSHGTISTKLTKGNTWTRKQAIKQATKAIHKHKHHQHTTRHDIFQDT